jgi:excisionase family DNA binding protein
MAVHDMHGKLPALLSVEEAGRLARISRRHAYKLVDDGTIPSVRLGGAIRVPAHRLLEILNIPPTQPEESAATAAAPRNGDARLGGHEGIADDEHGQSNG